MAVITLPNYLVINSVPLATPAGVLSEDSLRSLLGRSVRAGNVLIPYQAGRKPKTSWLDEFTAQMKFRVYGDADVNGVAHPSLEAGLLANWEYFDANVFLATAGGVESVPAELHYGGSVLTADVQVRPPSQPGGMTPTEIRCSFDLVIPAGRFV